jgi:hypothetical protein
MRKISLTGAIISSSNRSLAGLSSGINERNSMINENRACSLSRLYFENDLPTG